jgi:hypothetical protein
LAIADIRSKYFGEKEYPYFYFSEEDNSAWIYEITPWLEMEFMQKNSTEMRDLMSDFLREKIKSARDRNVPYPSFLLWKVTSGIATKYRLLI